MNEGEAPRWVDDQGDEAVQHGFRSTFRDWAAERTQYPRDTAEATLAHSIPEKVEAAYRRGDLFEKRRLIMEDWATYIAKVEKPAKVIDLSEARTAANASKAA